MIDKSWYSKPKERIIKRVTSGGIVARKEGETVYVALILEGRFRDYSLPKGGVKRGESLEEAARREIHEEAGFSQLDLVEYLGKKERLNISKTKWTTIHFFLFITQQKGGKPTDQEKRHIARWFPIDQLPRMLWPEQKALIVENREKIKSVFA